MIRKLYPDGKSKAFNVTYDDGVLQDKELISMLNKYGIKGTFNLNSALMKQEFAWFHECGMVVKRLSEKAVIGLYDGHEIASHTLNHPYMEAMSKEHILHEMVEDRDNLEELFDTEIVGFAAPFDYFDDVIAECAKISGFEYARTSEMTGGYSISDDFYHWKAGIFHLSANLESYIEGFLETDEELAIGQIVGHSYDLDAERIWDSMEALFEKVSGKDNVWYTTHIELVRYLRAMKKAVITEEYIQNNSELDLWFNVDGVVMKVKTDEKVYLN